MIVMLAMLLMQNQPPIAVAAIRACPECPRPLKGDCDCDGEIGFGDIQAFLTALIDGRTEWMRRYKCDVQPCRGLPGDVGCSYYAADLNCDGLVDFGDINPFVLALVDYQEYLAQPCRYVNRFENIEGVATDD
jgi:hypothetical protein